MLRVCVNAHMLLQVTLGSTRFKEGCSNIFFSRNDRNTDTYWGISTTHCHLSLPHSNPVLIVPMIHTPPLNTYTQTYTVSYYTVDYINSTFIFLTINSKINVCFEAQLKCFTRILCDIVSTFLITM